MTCNTDLETWLHDIGEDRIFRILEYRKPGQYTPYEMENKFVDESLYIENIYKHVIIEEVIELPDKDLLIGFKEVEDILDYNEYGEEEKEIKIRNAIEYLKLSEIRLECFADDQLGGKL